MAIKSWQYFRDLLVNGAIPVGQDYTDLVDTIADLVDTIEDSKNVTESQVLLEKEYSNIKKISSEFVNVGTLYVEHYGDGYTYAYNYDSDLDPNSKLFDVQVGDVVYVTGLDGEIASLTITDYVYSDAGLLEFEFGSLDFNDFLDSSGNPVSDTNTNFFDVTGSTKFDILMNVATESVAENVADALSYVNENLIPYTASNGVALVNKDFKLGGTITEEVEIIIDTSINSNANLTTKSIDTNGNTLLEKSTLERSDVVNIYTYDTNGDLNSSNNFIRTNEYSGGSITDTSGNKVTHKTTPSLYEVNLRGVNSDGVDLYMTSSFMGFNRYNLIGSSGINFNEISTTIYANSSNSGQAITINPENIVVNTPINKITEPKSVATKEYVEYELSKPKTISLAPTSSSDTGTKGEIRYTSTGLYMCIDTDYWVDAMGNTF